MVLLNATDIISSTVSLSISNIQVSVPSLWGWAALSGMALAASVAFLAAMYLWATLFKNPQLTSYAKQELSECVITAFLILIIFGMIGGLSSMQIGSYVPDMLLPEGVYPNTTIYEATQLYYERVEADMSAWLNLNYVMGIYVDQMASVTPYSRPLGIGLVASPLTGAASPLKQLLYNMTTALSLAFIINHAQLVVYLFSLQAFLNYYLPAGIFLRSFTPTRRLGGTLIGIALTFLFVFPALSTLTYSIFYSKDSGPLVSFGHMLVDYYRDLSGGGFYDALNQLYTNNFGFNSGMMNLVGGPLGGIGDILQIIAGKLLLGLFLIPMAMISFAFILGFVIPAINVIIFTAAAKVMSKSLGEEVDISSLTRMI